MESRHLSEDVVSDISGIDIRVECEFDTHPTDGCVKVSRMDLHAEALEEGARVFGVHRVWRCKRGGIYAEGIGAIRHLGILGESVCVVFHSAVRQEVATAILELLVRKEFAAEVDGWLDGELDDRMNDSGPMDDTGVRWGA